MKRILLVALAAVTMFASCSKEGPDGNNNGAEKTVSITFNRAAVTRAADAPVATGAYTTIESARIYFYNAAGTKVFGYVLSALDITALNNITNHSAVIDVLSVPTSAAKLFIVANASAADYTFFADATLANAKAHAVTLDSQKAVATQGIDKLILTGENTTWDTSVPDKVTTAATITPIVARLEIADFFTFKTVTDFAAPTAVGQTLQIVGGTVAIEAMYINSIYGAGVFDGATGASLLYSNTANDYSNTYGNGDPLYSFMRTAFVDKAAGANINAFHIFPNLNTAGSTEKFASDFPAIIFKLSNVQIVNYSSVDGATWTEGITAIYGTGTAFITAQTYKIDGAMGTIDQTYVRKFEAAKIYKIASIKAGSGDLRDLPYTHNLDIEVTVTVAPWEAIGVTPEL